MGVGRMRQREVRERMRVKGKRTDKKERKKRNKGGLLETGERRMRQGEENERMRVKWKEDG
jgi:hypothetical protein